MAFWTGDLTSFYKVKALLLHYHSLCLWPLSMVFKLCKTFTLNDCHTYSSTALWSRRLVISRDKRSLLYINYHLAYDHQVLQMQTYLDGLLSYSHTTFKKIVLLDHLITGTFNTLFSQFMTTRPSRVLTTERRLNMQMLISICPRLFWSTTAQTADRGRIISST